MSQAYQLKAHGGLRVGGLALWQRVGRIQRSCATSNFKFGIQVGLGEQLTMKQLLEQKLAGVWAREH